MSPGIERRLAPTAIRMGAGSQTGRLAQRRQDVRACREGVHVLLGVPSAALQRSIGKSAVYDDDHRREPGGAIPFGS